MSISALASPEAARRGPTPASVERLQLVAAGGGLIVAALSLAQVGLQAEIVLADPTTDETTLLSQWALFDASGGLVGITPFLRAALVGAISLVVISQGRMWRWVGWFGLAVSAANVLGGLDFVVTADVSLTGHPLLDLFAFLVWILLASVVLLVQPRGHAEA